MVSKVRNKGVTFDEFANELLKYGLTSSFDARCIDIVFDVYRETSTKNSKRGHREVGRLHFKKIIRSQYIKQWGGPFYHGTIIRTGITCKKIPCYMRDSTCR